MCKVCDSKEIKTVPTKTELKVIKIINNIDPMIRLYPTSMAYLISEGVAMREIGYTWKRIDKALADKAEYL